MNISKINKNWLVAFLIVTVWIPFFSYAFFHLVNSFFHLIGWSTLDISQILPYLLWLILPLSYYLTLNLIIKAFLPYSSIKDRLKYILIITTTEIAILIGYILFMLSLVNHDL